jgi:hypothetical protein
LFPSSNTEIWESEVLPFAPKPFRWERLNQQSAAMIGIGEVYLRMLKTGGAVWFSAQGSFPIIRTNGDGRYHLNITTKDARLRGENIEVVFHSFEEAADWADAIQLTS